MKRIFEVASSIILLVILLPLFFAISILILLCDGLPIFYFSKRLGQYKKYFWMVKFKTMDNKSPAVSTACLDNPNLFVTKLGHFLRKTSLDELPQLINIIKGDMSFVGPRPALYNQYELIRMRESKNIYTLPQGLTGWAQINGRDTLTNTEKVNFEKEYLEKKSWRMDLLILFLTLFAVFKIKHVSH